MAMRTWRVKPNPNPSGKRDRWLVFKSGKQHDSRSTKRDAVDLMRGLAHSGDTMRIEYTDSRKNPKILRKQ